MEMMLFHRGRDGFTTMEYILRTLSIVCLGLMSHAAPTERVTSTQIPKEARINYDYTTNMNDIFNEITTLKTEIRSTMSDDESRGVGKALPNRVTTMTTTGNPGITPQYELDITTERNADIFSEFIKRTEPFKPPTGPSTTDISDVIKTSLEYAPDELTTINSGRFTTVNDTNVSHKIHRTELKNSIKTSPEIYRAITTVFVTSPMESSTHSEKDEETKNDDVTELANIQKETNTITRVALSTPAAVATKPRVVKKPTVPRNVYDIGKGVVTTNPKPPTEKNPQSRKTENSNEPVVIDGPIGDDLNNDFSEQEDESINDRNSINNHLYEHSPQYLQRRTINHAAIWITVGFVAILMTYILALFIHEKGRSEWRLATQDYSKFENEDETSQDEISTTSILSAINDVSCPSSNESVSIDITQDMALKPCVDTTRCH